MVKKDVMHRFWRVLAPRPVSLVTCTDKEGKPNIITLAWTSPLSIRPPLVAIVIGKGRYSHKLLEETGEFVVNIPSEDLIDQTHFCGTTSGRRVDKFKETGLTALPAKKVGVPIIKECIAHLECRITERIPAGDHTIFIGEVLAAYADEEFFDVRWDLTKPKRPILHIGNKAYAKPEKI
jgi:flavin reductase (DIM6/NTAB) family NADH-FMN oxidoreductase RutF